MNDKIARLIQDSIEAKQKLLAPEYVAQIAAMGERIVAAYRSCKKVLVFGNGGSAADAQHFAAELIVRFEKNRMALPAIALTTDSSIITATGNDFGYDEAFRRQVEALALPGDIVVGISTSGNSPNVLKAMEQAKAQKAFTIGFTGEKGGKLKETADLCFCAPSNVTGRIQECHILAIHILCSIIEEALFENER